MKFSEGLMHYLPNQTGCPTVDAVINELRSARAKFPAMHSAHEGYAVLLEEMDELWDEIKTKGASIEKMRAEAIQVAAMAIRFIEDVCQ